VVAGTGAAADDMARQCGHSSGIFYAPARGAGLIRREMAKDRFTLPSISYVF